MKAGAFGNWRKINEKFDLTIVKQVSEKGVSCVSAVGEMLLKSRNIFVTQAEILDIIGEPASIEMLKQYLNNVDTAEKEKSWQGGYSDDLDIDFLITKRNFCVFLKEFGSETHAVFIEKFDGNFFIKDTFDQSSYQMTKDDFYNAWTGAYLNYYWKNKK